MVVDYIIKLPWHQIIMPNTACEGGNMTKLFQLISEQFNDTNLATVQRKYFNESKGMQVIVIIIIDELSFLIKVYSISNNCVFLSITVLKWS